MNASICKIPKNQNKHGRVLSRSFHPVEWTNHKILSRDPSCTTSSCVSEGVTGLKGWNFGRSGMSNDPRGGKKIKLERSKLESIKNHSILHNSIICALKLSWQLSWHEIWPMLRPAGHVFFPMNVPSLRSKHRDRIRSSFNSIPWYLLLAFSTSFRLHSFLKICF